ncbi:MAG: glycosyltransferase [Leptospiraceae bacterium]|nr:glycosyltransferase [Leptospiraceae bacterium]
MSAQKLLVVIPAHNEAETIYEVVTRSLKYADVSVTDDGSRDETPRILESIRAECAAGKHPHTLHIITHPTATHIPRGIQDGLRYGVQQNYDWIVTMDAGLSHDPDALPQFFEQDAQFDVVIGSRQKIENVPFYRRVISRSAAMVVNYALTSSYFDLMGPGLRDCTSGYRRYSRAAAGCIAGVELESKAFDFHMEALALCYRAGMRVTEIPIHYVFSNSSFNSRVLKQAMRFGLHLIGTKGSAPHMAQSNQ